MTPFSGRSGNTPIQGQRIQYGSLEVTGGIAAGGYTDAALTFPEPFAAPPTVVAIPNWWGVSCSVFGTTTTGATIRAFSARTTNIGGSVTCRWIAIGV